MGCHGGWAETGCIRPTGLLPDRENCVGRVFDSGRLLDAEERIAELIAGIQPNERTGKRRKDIADYVQSLIGKCFPCQVFIFGSVPLMTYLPDGDIDLTVFSDNENSKDTWADKFYQVMKDDKKNENAEFHVKEVQLIVAEVKVIKCLVEDIVVDISFHQTGGLRALCFLEEMGHLINQDNLFKRSIILIKAWCYYESRILGAHHGLISTYALETMIVYIFHVFDNSFSGPLEVLYRFLEFFSNFDWENFCISIWGPVPLQLLPDIAVIPPRKNNGEFFPKKFFLESRSMFIDSLACDQQCQRRSFASKYFNVVDPLCAHNNLGRSVYKGNFHRICSAFVFGAKKLAKLLDLPKEEMIFELSQFFKSTWKRHRSGLHSSSPARMEHLKPYKSIQVGASNICMNISNEEQSGHISEDPVDVGLSFYGASSQILRMINQNSEDVSRHNGIQMAVCNAKKEQDCSSEIIIKSQDYVEKAFDSAKPVRTDKNHENLSYSNSNNIEEGDCRLQGQLSRSCSPKTCFRSDPMNVSEVSSAEGVDIVQKSDTHEAFPVSSELDCSSKSLATGIMSSQAVTSIDDSICLNQNSSFQSTVSNAASHGCHDSASSTIETPSKMQSRYSYNEYPAQEMYRAPTMVGNNEVPINVTVQISDDDNIIATGQLLPSNPQQRAIPNSVVVPCTLYPTGPPVPFLEMLQTYNFPSYRSYYDGLYGLFDDETSNFDRNVNLCRMFAQPEIHDATPAKPILSHGLPHPNIPLLGLSSYAYPTVARNAYCRRIFPPNHPIRSILPQGTQLMPATCVLPEAQIRTYPSNPRVVLRDQSPTTRHSWNYTHYGGNLDKGQQICIHRRPQAFWLANEPNHCFAPNYIQTAGSFDLCRSKEIAPHLGENGSIGSSNFSHVSTYMTQGMDYSQSSTAQASSSQHQRLLVEKNRRLKEENFPQ